MGPSQARSRNKRLPAAEGGGPLQTHRNFDGVSKGFNKNHADWIQIDAHTCGHRPGGLELVSHLESNSSSGGKCHSKGSSAAGKCSPEKRYRLPGFDFV